ncbi:MAG TPA: Ig-like domain-containing protein [Anaerolineales bacterium]|nr:Ig-like domain-containing protein [Anaerolineales bacterium]
MKATLRPGFILILLISLTLVPLAFAQTDQEELSLRLSRDFGYSSGTGKIQGAFSMTATSPRNLVRVMFYIDGESIGEITQAPFRLRFSTGDHPLGVHTLSALGYTEDGRELRSNEIRVQFVAAEEGWQAGLKIAIPLLAIVFGAMILSFVVPLVFNRGRASRLPLGAPRNYGIIGGAICPKCKRPFGMHFYGLNLIAGKLERCPYCGKWSLVRRASPGQLASAEAAELAQAKEGALAPHMSEEEHLKRELADSRFDDLTDLPGS